MGSEARHMIEDQLIRRGIADPRVLAAIEAIPRQAFVPDDLRSRAYLDGPLPIGCGQTISQPYVVALMSELAGVGPGKRVLEIGTGSGYQAAVLAQLGAEVYSIEIHPELSARAARVLAALDLPVHLRVGDGYAGWAEEAPFDLIILTAAPGEIPAPLEDQLAVGGRLIAPVGTEAQELIVADKTESGWQRRSVLPVRFVPMTGRAQGRPMTPQ